MAEQTPPWLGSLREAMKTVDGPRLVTLATLAGDGSPRVRTLVVREVEGDGSLLMSSDARSEKNGQVRHDSRAAGALWFEGPKLQFRLRGRCEVAEDDATRRRIWTGQSDRARALFAWPASGEPRADDSEFVEKVAEGEPMPANFEVMRLTAAEVDRLDLSDTPHRRTIYDRAGGAWRSREVNP